MHIYIGADHRGFALKEQLKEWLQAAGQEVTDCGNTRHDPDDDYPDFSLKVAEHVAAHGQDARGIVVCGSGVGVTISANKVKGIRATTAISTAEVQHARSHDDLNVLAISADYTQPEQAKDMIDAFLHTDFSTAPRHQRRLQKIADYEAAP